MEDPTDLGTTAIKMICYCLQRQGRKKLAVDIAHDLAGKAVILESVSVGSIKNTVQNREEQQKPSNQIQPHIRNTLKGKIPEYVLQLCIAGIPAAVMIQLSQRTFQERPLQSHGRVDLFQHRR